MDCAGKPDRVLDGDRVNEGDCDGETEIEKACDGVDDGVAD